jgi:hypothetical protein
MNDPRRWTDEGGESTALERELVGAGRDAGPSREQKRKIWGAIAGQAAVAATGAGAASASGGAAAATGLTVLKATTIVVLVGAGIVAATRAVLTPAVPTPPSAAAAAPPPRSPPDDQPPPPSAPPAPVADPAAARPVKVAHPAPRPAAAATAALADNARASQLREESAMILDARRVLRGGDPARALALLDAARARFPAGILVQEREALTIEALVRAGQRALATKRAEAFLRDYPKSPHAADVRSAVVEP